MGMPLAVVLVIIFSIDSSIWVYLDSIGNVCGFFIPAGFDYFRDEGTSSETNHIYQGER
jgi:hypothetical protein